MRILGIDPGSTLIGYGLIEKEANNELTYLTHGTIVIKEKTIPEKLRALSIAFEKLLTETKPEAVGVESLFFAKNKKTALEVAHARGVIIMHILKENLPLLELKPVEIKQTVTGSGAADKKSVAKMVAYTLKLDTITGDDNAADGLATAIATAALHLNPLRG